MNDKLPQKWFAKPEQTGFTVRQWWAFRSRLQIESLSATQTRGGESLQIRGPAIKVLDTHFCYFLPCYALQPSVKNKLFLETLQGFAHHKMKPCRSHFTVHTTTNNLVSGISLFILSFHVHSRATLIQSNTHTRLNENKCTALSVKFKPNL